jgi:serine/threonine-protein kinase ULK/ATG1
VAIKSVNITKLSKKLRDNLNEEVNILKNLHHPHIVALFACRESKTQMHLIMEYCELGDLSSFIRKRASLGEHETTRDMIQKYPCPAIGGLNEVVTRHFAQQIGSAIQWIRQKNYLHRDIKPQNLLLVPSPIWYEKHHNERTPLMVDEDQEGTTAGIMSLPMLKIADFGFARHLPSLSLAETLCGSPLYMAPEILRYEKYDAVADLWSVGTVLHEMMVGKPPFRAGNHVELLRKIEKNEDKIRFPEGLAISSDMKQLIRALLKRHPTERMSYESFFAHPVVVGEIPGLVGEDRPSEKITERLASRHSKTKRSESFASSSKVPPTDIAARPRPEYPSERPGSRPASRPASYAESSRTPPTTSAGEQRQSPNTYNDAQYAKPRERRPTLTSNATAPARQQVRPPTAAAIAIERRNSRVAASPGASMLKEHLDRERGRLDEKALREAREIAAQDIAFERDYVVVEKKQVEVNAFADELANSPHVQGQQQQQGVMIRRATTSGAPLSSTAPQSTQSRAMQIAGRQATSHQRTGSYERRYGRSPTSATSAISKALGMAHVRLFGGLGLSPPSKGPSPQGYGAFPTYPTAQSSMLVIGEGSRGSDQRDEDGRLAMHIEELAHRSDVVWGFAEVKYQQLLPSRPISSHGLGIGGARKAMEEPEAIEEDDLTVDSVVTISEEALVLYVKALAILAKVIDTAGSWWGHQNRGEVFDVPRSAPVRTAAQTVGPRINGVVQWARNRFNECLEKSEFVGRKLLDAQKQLPTDHPGHPSNHPTSSVYSTSSVGTSTEQIRLTSGITAEKLMYDRALEMSRTAAVNELMNEDFEGGILSYRTAISMLEAILDNDDDISGRRRGITERAEDEVINGLESEDRATVKKRKYYPHRFLLLNTDSFIVLEGLRIRLRTLKRKIEVQKAAKRTSISTAPAGHTPPGRNSPSATPIMSNTPPR